MTATQSIINRLFALKDDKYAAFSASLVPNIAKERFIGVRTPQLRQLAKELSGTDEAQAFAAALPHYYQEENCLHALLIERLKDEAELLSVVRKTVKHERRDLRGHAFSTMGIAAFAAQEIQTLVRNAVTQVHIRGYPV